MYKSEYYRFGPSNGLKLAFTNIVIDNWWKYNIIMVYLISNCIIKVISGDLVYPWINAVVMNPTVRVGEDKRGIYGVVNYYWGINSVHNIFFFALSYSQVDFAVYIIIGSIIGGLISSRYIIYGKSNNYEGIN